MGAPLYEGLGDELKPEGLGGGGGEQAHECKDCERMFPSKYRCRPSPSPACPAPPAPSPPEPTSPVHTDTRTVPGTGGDKGPLWCGTARGQAPALIRHQGRSRPRSWWWWPQGILALAVKARPLFRAPHPYKIHKWPGRDIASPTILQAGLSCGDSLGGE